MIAFNSGRGRGRPKKNSLGSRNLVEPTSVQFFRTIDKVGGPIEPTVGFDEIYTEIFIKKKAKVVTPAKEETNQPQSGAEDGPDNEGVVGKDDDLTKTDAAKDDADKPDELREKDGVPKEKKEGDPGDVAMSNAEHSVPHEDEKSKFDAEAVEDKEMEDKSIA